MDEFVAEVRAVAAGLRHPRWSDGLYASLRASLSLLAERELERLLRHNSESAILPVPLGSEVTRWKSAIQTSELRSAARLRAFQWRATVQELLHRCSADWDRLVKYFAIDPAAKITAISAPLGDPHCGGRAVYRITLDDEHRLIYKPRSVTPEYLFGHLLHWLAQNKCEPNLEPCLVLPRAGYGWVRHVVSEPCRTPDEAEVYYQKQGAFLAIFFFIGGADCLDENVVVNGENPVWIDTECLFHPSIPQISAGQQVPTWMKESVLATAFVFAGSNTGVPAGRNRTALSLRTVAQHFSVFAQDGVLERRYLEAVKSGFSKVYQWVLAHRRAWTSARGPLSWWNGRYTRVMLRPTVLYTALSDALLLAPAEAKGRCREAVSDVLAGPTRLLPWPEAVVRADLAALEMGDIPYWSSCTSSKDLREARGAVVDNLAELSGLESLRVREARMSDTDLENQLWLIDTFLRLG